MADIEKVTFIGLHKWFEHVFEKCGWIIICGDANRKYGYQHEIQSLINHLKAKMSEIEEKDRKADLAIMLDKTQTLYMFVAKEFKGGARKTKGKSKSKSKSKGNAKAKAKGKSKSKSKSKSKAKAKGRTKK